MMITDPARRAAQPAARLNSASARRFATRRKLLAALPAMPLLVFLCAFLLVPLAIIVKTAFEDPEIATILPATVVTLADWDGQGLPGDDSYRALARDLARAKADRSTRQLGRRLEYAVDGGMTAVTKGTRAASAEVLHGAPQEIRQALITADPAWGQPGIWQAIAEAPGRTSLFYLKWALGFDIKRAQDGGVSQAASYDFLAIYGRTLMVSLMVTALTVLIGYPLAYVVSGSTGNMGKLLIFLVLLPFWTSLLVRTMSWIVMLQRNGVLNDLLMATGLISDPAPLLYTRFATVLAMVQIQLPFTVLPMVTVMQAIPKAHVRAARSLGAGPLHAHFSVFTPQAVPGIAAGALLTFVLCLGFYLTPALVGGPGDQMVSTFIARFTNEQLNWGLASALSVVLMAGAAVIAVPLSRYVSKQSATRG